MTDHWVWLDRLDDHHFEQLGDLFRATWWASDRHRQPERLRQMVAASDEVLGVCDRRTGRLIGFARVLTDYTYRAVLWDVVVDPAYRGQGVGRLIVQALRDRPALRNIDAFLLMCLPEMVPFYQQLGFEPETKVTLMIASGGGFQNAQEA